MEKRFFPVLAILFISLTACNLRVPDGSIPASPIDSIQGTWTGTLIDSTAGISYHASLVIEQPAGGTSLQAVMSIHDQSGSHQEVYNLSGEFNATTIRFNEPEGRFFWGTADSSGMYGQVGWCHRCEAWGEFDLTPQGGLSAETTESPYSIQFFNLQDGDVLTPIIAVNGFPVVDTRIGSTTPLPMGTALVLEVDGLWMNQVLTEDIYTPAVPLQWTAWHGNGGYSLTIQALNMEAGGVLAYQTIQVMVSGIPEGTLTVRERLIQVFQQEFGLSLTAPAFARYTKPNPGAVEESRWVSTAYIGSKLYEINIFDNGFTGALAYHLDAENGFCRPAGFNSMLVIFVDYGNTGLDPALGAAPMEQWRQEANLNWADYSTSIGLTEPILQIDRMEMTIVTAPPAPGQTLTVDDVRTLTGKNPSDFDWLVEIDLDTANSVAGKYGGLGASLNGGCLPGGAQRANIVFSAIDQPALIDDAPGSVFGHELAHGMGWQHWWPNGLANNQDWMIRSSFWMPTLLFGWTDTDGDGTIEILDASTPYGLIP